MHRPENITLYYKPTCPYCQKVLDYLENLHKTVPLKNVKGSPEHLEELKKLSTKTQVPCLVIDGQALLESDDIILWLEEHQSYLQNTPKGQY